MYKARTFTNEEKNCAAAMRTQAEVLERMIRHITPSRERSLALTKLDETLLWANTAIAAGQMLDHEE